MDNKRAFGVEIEHGNAGGESFVRQQLKLKFPKWDNVGVDGSGVEVRSPILKGQSGLDELGEVMEFLVEIGGYVSKSDGMHVHHDGRDVAKYNQRRDGGVVYNPRTYDYEPIKPTAKDVRQHEAVIRVIESYTLNQKIIDKLVDPYRRGWMTISPSELKEWKRRKAVETGRKNVHFSPHSTFEFRQFEGCLEPAKAIAWIEFGQHFLNYTLGLSRPTSCAESAQTLLQRIGATKAEILLNRPRNTQLKDHRDADYVRSALHVQPPQYIPEA